MILCAEFCVCLQILTEFQKILKLLLNIYLNLLSFHLLNFVILGGQCLPYETSFLVAEAYPVVIVSEGQWEATCFLSVKLKMSSLMPLY